MNSNATVQFLFVGGAIKSGSTLVDQLLSTQKGFIGLGEVDHFVQNEKICHLRALRYGPYEKLPCSCGKNFESCAFWGPLTGPLRPTSDLSYFERYASVVEQAEQIVSSFNRRIVMIDSSKEPEALTRLHDFSEALFGDRHRVKVVLVFRDPRNWLISDERNSAAGNRLRNLRVRRRRMRKWAKRYLTLKKVAESRGLELVVIRLKDIQRNPNLAIRVVLARLLPDWPFCPFTTLADANSHIVWGSHHRLSASTSGQIWQNYRLERPGVWLVPWLTTPTAWLSLLMLNWMLWKQSWTQWTQWAPWDSNPRPTD
jgi:hypothetical protein